MSIFWQANHMGFYILASLMTWKRRITDHKLKLIKGFTAKYNVHMLVYYEEYDDVHQAIQREKTLKRWYRDWKIDLINKHNPEWKDLAENIMDPRVKPEDDKVSV